MTSLTAVEFRKLTDTRPMHVTLAAAGLSIVGLAIGQTLRGVDSSFGEVSRMSLLFAPYFLLAVAAVAVTAETTHHTSLTTFALSPRRIRVLVAKATAVVVLAVIMAVVALLVGAAVTAGVAGPWTLQPTAFGIMTLGLVITALMGWALGMATGSTVLAVMLYLVFPIAASLAAGLSQPVGDALAWIRPDAVFELGSGAPDAAGHAVVSVLVWLVGPAVLGVVRLAKGEVR